MIHYKYTYLWIGITDKSEEDYNKYFEIDYSIEDIDDPDYKPCQFCKDIGEKWYDEDFIIMNSPLEKEIDIEDFIKTEYSGVDKQEYEKILNKCMKLNILKANALISYSVSDDKNDLLDIPNKNIYFNGLKYIGCFLHE